MPQPRMETAFWSAAAAALVALALLGLWPWAAVAGACLALAALLPAFTALSGLRFPLRLTVGVAAFCAAALLFGEMGDGYEAVPWWDMALHLVSMAVLAVVGMGLALLPTGGARPRTPVWVLSTLAFAFAMMVGALWEVMEFGLDSAFGFETQDSGLDDTMWDVIANAVGAAWGAVAAHGALLRGRALAPAGLLLDWIAANAVLYPLWSGPFEVGRRPLAGEDGALQRGG